MPDCHQCSLNGRADSRCLTCRGPAMTPHNSGRSICSLDEVQGGQLAVCDPAPHADTPFDALIAVLRTMLELSHRQFTVVAGRMLHSATDDPRYTYEAIGGRLGISVQAAEKLHRSAMLRWPILRHAFRNKVQKQLRRAGR